MPPKSERGFFPSLEEVESRLLPALEAACSIETCYPKAVAGWTTDNPLWGHCGVVAEVVRRHLGGEIVTATVTTEDGETYYHYWNRLPDGTDQDLTVTQFPSPITEVKRLKIKKQVTDRDTLKRVKLFEARLLEIISEKLFASCRH